LWHGTTEGNGMEENTSYTLGREYCVLIPVSRDDKKKIKINISVNSSTTRNKYPPP